MNTSIYRFVCVAMLTLCFIPSTTTEAQLFYPSVEYGAGEYPRSVAIGDLDGDSYPDLAVANYGPSNGNVSVLLSNGDGTFQTAVNYGAGDCPRSVAIGDLDGDSYPDLAVANHDSDNVSVLLGNGDGTFQADVTYGAGDGPYSVAIGDLNSDGNLDLATANYLSDTVSVLLGNGDGTFHAAVNYGTGNEPRPVAIGDLDGDSHLDLAVANVFSDNVSILLGDGGGTFQAAVNYEVDNGPSSVAIGDLDGDSFPDLAVGNEYSGNVSVLINEGTNAVGLTCDPSFGTVPFSTQMTVTLENLYAGQTRRIAGRINVLIASGNSYSNWKSGWTNVAALSSYVSSWNQTIPALGSVIGDNVFTLKAEDVTPSPYNQPPHPPSGDTDTSVCTVMGIAP